MSFREFLEHEAEGVITAYNPFGQKSSEDENKHANQQLCQDLADHGPQEIEGTYNGHNEKAFLIPKIGKGKILDLARKYKQDAVIWNGQIIKVEKDHGREISGCGSQSSDVHRCDDSD